MNENMIYGLEDVKEIKDLNKVFNWIIKSTLHKGLDGSAVLSHYIDRIKSYYFDDWASLDQNTLEYLTLIPLCYVLKNRNSNTLIVSFCFEEEMDKKSKLKIEVLGTHLNLDIDNFDGLPYDIQRMTTKMKKGFTKDGEISTDFIQLHDFIFTTLDAIVAKFKEYLIKCEISTDISCHNIKGYE